MLTAGFHTLFTLVAGRFGLAPHAAFGYAMKEGGPFFSGLVTGNLAKTYEPSPAQKKHGWTRRWVITDSLADVAGPVLVVLLYAVGILA
jgi:hypothetical protein